MTRFQIRQSARRTAQRMRLSQVAVAVGAAMLLVSGSAEAYRSVFIETPNGRPFIELSILEPGEDEDVESPREVTDQEIDSIREGLSYWGRMLEDGLQNTAPAQVYVGAAYADDFNAFAGALGDGDFVDAPLTAFLTQNRGSGKETAVVQIMGDTSGTLASPDYGPLKTIPDHGDLISLSATIVHEFAHAFGMMVDYTDGSNGFGENLSTWEAGLRDIEGEAARPSMAIGMNGTQEGVFDVGDCVPGEGGEEYGGVYFTGEHVEEVLDGALIKFPDASDKYVPGIPVLGWEDTYVSDGEGGWTVDAIAELSHIELQNSLLSHQYWRNWTTLMEAELAVMQDFGMTIYRKDWFGYSVYVSGEAGNLNVVVNTTPFYARNEDGTDWHYGAASDNPWGIGLHIYGSYNDVTQAADILTAGSYALGVRMDGFGNTLRIPSTTTIRADGAEGYGLAVTYGTHHSIVQQGTVIALGQEGVAALFSFGDNTLGNAIEERGSFLYTQSGASLDPSEIGLDGALVDRYDLSGTLAGGGAAIGIDDNALVREINVLAGAKILGDIVSLWDPTADKLQTGDMPLSELVTDLRFGLATAEDGSALEMGDASFSMYYDGNIHGAVSEDEEASPASIAMSLEGGTLTYDGEVSVLSVTVKEGATLAGNGTFTVTSIENATEALGGVFLNEGTLSPGIDGLGSMTIRGTFEQADSGVLRMEFDAQGATDRLVLEETGSSSDALGGTIELAPVRDYYATGTVAFSLQDMIETDLTLPDVETVDLSTLSPVLTGGAEMTNDGDVFFTIDRQAGAYLQYAASEEGADVAAAFEKNAGSATGAMQDLVTAIDFSNPDGSVLRDAFEQLTPNLYGRAGAAAVAAQRTVTTALLSRSTALFDADLHSTLSDADARTFVMPLGGYAKKGAEGYRTRYAGLLAGVEKATGFSSGTLTFGGHTAVLSRKDKFQGKNGKVDAETFYLGLHGRYDFASVPGLFGFGYWQGSVENADLTRCVRFEGYSDTAESDWTAWGMSLAAGVGHAFRLTETIALRPVWYLDYSFSHRPDVTESSDHGAALRVLDETYESLRSSLGVRLEAALPLGAMKSRMAASLWWNHELMDDFGATSAAFRGWRDTTFDVVEEVDARDTGTAAVSFTGQINDRFSTSLSVGADFGDGTHGAWGHLQLDWKF